MYFMDVKWARPEWNPIRAGLRVKAHRAGPALEIMGLQIFLRLSSFISLESPHGRLYIGL